MRRPIAKCPNCGSNTLKVRERSWAFQTFEQKDGAIDPEGWMTHGTVDGIDCTCSGCGFRWTPRGARQVTDLAGYPEDGHRTAARVPSSSEGGRP